MHRERARALLHGLVAGTIGFAVVAAIVVIGGAFDGAPAAVPDDGAPAAVPDAGERGGGALAWTAGVVAYNALALGVFLALGAAASTLAFFAAPEPRFWAAGLVLFVAALVHASGAVLLMDAAVHHEVPLHEVVASSALAPAAMALYLLGARLRRRAPPAQLRILQQ